MTATLLRPADRDCAELVAPGVLTDNLAAAFAGVRRKRVAVALRCGAREVSAALGDGGEESAGGWAAPLGCLAKLLTAELVRRDVAERRFELDTPAADLLGAGAAALRGVTVRQLLEHTHGFDDSLLAPPHRSGGFLDRAELVGRVARLARRCAPGAFYSYGNAGAWLVACALERLHTRPFGELVYTEQLAPLGVQRGAVPCCAATGVGIELTAEQLVRFVAQRPRLAEIGGAVTPLPGWHPLERGIRLGWKCAGAGWLGHQSVWPGASSYVRVNAERGVALAVVSRDLPAALVAARLFGAKFPELFELRAALRGGALKPAFAARWAQRYEQAAHVVEVERTRVGVAAVAWPLDPCGRPGGALRAALEPAQGGVWLAQPPNELLPYAEFIVGADGAPLLWNGRTVLRATRR